MADVEVTRVDRGHATVFEALPATVAPVRQTYLVYAALVIVLLVGVSELFEGPTATMMRWLSVLCAVPVILFWVMTMLEIAQRRVVRIAVTPEGLRVRHQNYPHATIRDLALYPERGEKPVFVARIAGVDAAQHQTEMGLVTGTVAVGGDGKAARRRRAAGFRLVMHRRNHQPAIVLVRGLTLGAGETLFAGLAAELRKHSR